MKSALVAAGESVDQVPHLIATAGPLKGQRFAVTEGGLLLGREDRCDVVIPDQSVSREHARLLLHNGTVWVQDAGSRNGVYVNQKRVVRHRPMGPGDQMTIGNHSFMLELAGMTDEASISVIRVGGLKWRGLIAAGLLGALGAGLALWLVSALKG